MNQNVFSIFCINNNYYVYTVTHIDGKVLVNVERVGR